MELPELGSSFKEIYLVALSDKNKAGYTATKVACGWAGAVKNVVNKAN